MTSTSTYARTQTDAPSRTPLFAALGLGAALVLTAIGFFWDITGNDGGTDSHAVRGYLVTAAIIVAATALIFGLVVRTAPGHRPGRRSAILGTLAVLSFPVFWLGLPSVFAAAATASALTDRDETGGFGKAAKAGLSLSVLGFLAAAVAAVIG